MPTITVRIKDGKAVLQGDGNCTTASLASMERLERALGKTTSSETEDIKPVENIAKVQA